MLSRSFAKNVYLHYFSKLARKSSKSFAVLETGAAGGATAGATAGAPGVGLLRNTSKSFVAGAAGGATLVVAGGA